MNGGSTIGDAMPGGPLCAIDKWLVAIEQSKKARVPGLAKSLPNAESVAPSEDVAVLSPHKIRKPSISIGRYWKRETREGAGLTREIADLTTKITSHRFH